MTSNVATALFNTTLATPSKGLELVLALVEDGRFTLDEVVEGKGPFFQSLIHHAAHVKGGFSSSSLSKVLFSLENLPRIQKASDNKAFSGKDRRNVWVPLSLLLAVERTKEAYANRSNHRSSVGEFTSADKKILDRWLASMIDTMPDAFWEEKGGVFLSKALSMGFSMVAHKAWVRADPLALNENSEPAILDSSKSVNEWKRFIEEGRDPDEVVNGKPLWKLILEKAASRGASSKESFLGGFEDWFVELAAKQPKFSDEILSLAQVRIGKISEYGSERWVALFKASSGKWVSWQNKKGVPVWHIIAVRSSSEFFKGMEQAGLDKEINPSDYALAKMTVAIQIIESNDGDTPAHIENFINVVKNQGWPAGHEPYIKRMIGIKIGAKSIDKILPLTVGNENAWWGEPESKDQVAKDIFMLLPGIIKKDKPAVLAWKGWVGSESSPWLDVGRGLADAVGGPMKNLQGISRTSLGIVARDPDGMKIIQEMSKNFSGNRRKEFDAWLESVKLEVSSPLVSARRASPRL